jgi:hypothetical protein
MGSYVTGFSEKLLPLSLWYTTPQPSRYRGEATGWISGFRFPARTWKFYSLQRPAWHWDPLYVYGTEISITIKKIKVTLVQALRLCTGRTAHRGSRGIALLFHDQGSRRVWGVSVTSRPLFTLGKTRYPLYRRLGGPQGRCRQMRKISPSTGIRSPDHPARSQPLYRLSYPAQVSP